MKYSENKENKEKTDMVNHPSHYEGKYECIEEMIKLTDRDVVANFCYGNVFKYIWRCWKKNNLEDIQKAKWYADKACELLCVDGVYKSVDDISKSYDKMLNAFGYKITVAYCVGEVFNILNTDIMNAPNTRTLIVSNLSIIKPLLDYADALIKGEIN